MSVQTITCRKCALCNVEEAKCKITGREVTLDSERKCKRGYERRS